MLITNATVITWGAAHQVLADHALRIDEGVVTDLAPTHALVERFPHDECLDAGGQFALPGGINAHTHFYGAFARGMAIPGAPPADFPEILRRLWWNLDKALDADAVRLSALVALVDAVKHGTTTLFDHHAGPGAIDGSLDVIARAVAQAGVRAALCYEVTDRDGADKAHAGIAENVRFLRDNRHPRLRALFGLHASLSLNDDTLRACAQASTDGRFHVHVAEHEADEDDSLRRGGQRVVRRLERFGIWDGLALAAHAVHVDADEADVLRQRGVWVTHQPRSNMNNAVGAAAFDTFMEQGVRLCIGTDGFFGSLWDEWKAAYFLHKVAHRDPRRANGVAVVQAGQAHNARLAQQVFGLPLLGTLAPGAPADLVLVDYHPFTPLTPDNLPWHILFGFESSMITTTIVDGKILMRDRRLLTLDEAAVAAEARALAPAVWARYNRYANQSL